jgi:hypothetical protein
LPLLIRDVDVRSLGRGVSLVLGNRGKKAWPGPNVESFATRIELE